MPHLEVLNTMRSLSQVFSGILRFWELLPCSYPEVFRLRTQCHWLYIKARRCISICFDATQARLISMQ